MHTSDLSGISYLYRSGVIYLSAVSMICINFSGTMEAVKLCTGSANFSCESPSALQILQIHCPIVWESKEITACTAIYPLKYIGASAKII